MALLAGGGWYFMEVTDPKRGVGRSNRKATLVLFGRGCVFFSCSFTDGFVAPLLVVGHVTPEEFVAKLTQKHVEHFSRGGPSL